MLIQAVPSLSTTLGRSQTTAELAHTLNINPATCKRALRALDRPISLSAAGGDEDLPLSKAVPDAGAEDPETLALDAVVREELRRLLIVLPAWERMILRDRFGLDGPPRTFKELA